MHDCLREMMYNAGLPNRPRKPDRRHPLVGIVVDGVSSYGRAVLRGVLRYANLERRWLLYKDLLDLRRLRDSADNWPRWDGAIVAADTLIFEQVSARCRHVVLCSGAGDPAKSPVVSLDDEAAGALAAEHLIHCRLKHFGFVGAPPGFSVGNYRRAGFQTTLRKHGYDCTTSPGGWPTGSDFSSHAHWPQLIRWLKGLPKPVGIMAADDSIANDLAYACMEAGLAVPDQIAIVGVNNDDLMCESAWPPLSSVEADFSRMGYEAAKMLDRMLAGKKLKKEERRVRLLPLGVVQRLSTDVLAVDDVNLVEALRFIREHACDPCGVGDILRHVPVGRRWLERQFATKLGKTPHQEIIRVRVERACALLMRPDMRMIEIAERCGYSGLANFDIAFRQSTGMTPSAFRRSARGSDRKN